MTTAAAALLENPNTTTTEGATPSGADAAPELTGSTAYLQAIFDLPVRPSEAGYQMHSHGHAASDISPLPNPSQPDTRKSSFGSRLWASAALLEERLHVTFRAAREDVRTSERKKAIVAAGIGCFAIKLAGKFKLPGMAVSVGTMDTLTATSSPVAAMGAAFVMSAAWSLTATAGVDNAINHFSRATDTIAVHFPKATKSAANALPGLNYTSERDKNSENTCQWLARTALTRLQRGHIASHHLTNYVTTAGYNGHTPEQRRRLRHAVSIDAAVITGGTYGLISEALAAIEPHDPDLAQHIIGAVENPLVLGGTSLLIIGGNATRNVLRNRKAKRSQAVLEPAILES